MDLSNFVQVMTFVTAGITAFFALKYQMDKLILVIKDLSKRIEDLTKTISAVEKINEQDHENFKIRMNDFEKRMDAYGQRQYECEVSCGKRT